MHKIQPQTDAQRIAALLDYTHLNGKNFALRIGLRYPDSIYHIQRGRNGISDKLADRIVMAFPEIDKGWLLSGEGDMLRSERNRAPVITPAPGRMIDTRIERQRVPLYGFQSRLVGIRRDDGDRHMASKNHFRHIISNRLCRRQRDLQNRG